MWKLALPLMLLLASPAYSLSKWHVEAYRGGATAVTSLGGRVMKAQRSLPGATITVYQTGTSTLVTLYSSAALAAKTNPFPADTNGYGEFFAADGCYDIKIEAAADLINSLPPVTRTISYVCRRGSLVSTEHNIKDYGAIGDGTTDDSAAILAAVTAAGNDDVVAPEGTFIVNQAFTLGGNLRCASSILTTFKVKNSSSFTNADNNYLFTAATGTVIENCKFDGNKANNSQKRITAVNIGGSTSAVTVRNSVFTNFPAYHVPASGVTGDVYAGDGIYISSSGSSFRIESCNFASNERSGMVVARGSDLTIDKCLFDGNGTFAVDIEPDNDVSRVLRVTISNSRFMNSASPAFTSYGGGLYIVGRSTGLNYIEDVTLSNNLVTGNRVYGLRVEGVDGLHVATTRSFDNSKGSAGGWPNFYIGDYTRQITILGSAFAQTGTDNPSYSVDVANTANVADVIMLGVYYSTVNDPGKKISVWLGALIRNIFYGSDSWNPGVLAAAYTAGSTEAKDVTVTGAAAGNPCIASLTTINTTVNLDCNVISANTARVVVQNLATGGTLDLGPGAVHVYVWKP